MAWVSIWGIHSILGVKSFKPWLHTNREAQKLGPAMSSCSAFQNVHRVSRNGCGFDHIPCSHPPIISHYIMWHEYPLISFNMMQFAEDGPHLRISESDHFSKFFPIFSAFQPASTQLGPGTSELKLVRWETWQLSLGQEMPGESNMISIRKASNFGGKCCTQTAVHVQTIHFWATDLEPYNQWGCELSA